MSNPRDHVQDIASHPPGEDRVPAGQHVTEKWPVLTYGPTPEIEIEQWSLRVFGACATPITLDWAALSALPFVQVRCDFHCVTTWSRLGMVFGGYRVRDVLALAGVNSDATHVMQHAYGGYTVNTDIEAICDDDVLIAIEADGAELHREHGGPARIVVPKRWAWKGAKWVNGLELMTADRRGFWEENGYHIHADPWGPEGERYRDQEQAWETRKRGNDLRRR
jgi:DMSO/TMAO reductase YedYZ molybdopterin-dependent catalytic subunit